MMPLFNSAVYYGTSCFETMKSESEKIFKFDEHINRLNSGLLYLGLKEDELPDPDRVQKEIGDLLTANELQNTEAKVRYQVSLQETGGYGFDHSREVLTMGTANRIIESAQPISLEAVETRVIPSLGKPALHKTSNMLHYRNAYREAQEKGADDGLMLTIDGYIAETSIANIFWKKGNVIFSPSAECDILPGIMRETVIEIIEEEQDLRLQEGSYTLSDLESAEVVWVTNSVRELVLVERVGTNEFNNESRFLDSLRNKLEMKKRRYFS